uniref:F-box domain-containing protein n=1 Tax=Grammatophora oceanica TaxID=210454 RepID=A0A7S1VJW9_9STRA
MEPSKGASTGGGDGDNEQQQRRSGDRKRVRSPWIDHVVTQALHFIQAQQQQQRALAPGQPSRKQARRSSVIEFLPDEVVAKVFFSGFMDSIEIIRTLSVVSKRLNKIAHSTVNMLDLRGCTSLTPIDTSSLVSRYSNLTELHFDYCKQFGDDHLVALSSLNDTLHGLHLRGTSVTDRGFAALFGRRVLGENISNLKVLDLGVVTKDDCQQLRITDATVDLLPENCPHLRVLILDWCKGVTTASMTSIAKLVHLSSLSLMLTSVGDVGELTKIPRLASLDLSAAPLTEEGLLGLLKGDACRLPYLRELKLRFQRCLTEAVVDKVAAHVPRLKFLDIRNSSLSASDKIESVRSLKFRGVTVQIDLVTPSAPTMVRRRPG